MLEPLLLALAPLLPACQYFNRYHSHLERCYTATLVSRAAFRARTAATRATSAAAPEPQPLHSHCKRCFGATRPASYSRHCPHWKRRCSSSLFLKLLPVHCQREIHITLLLRASRALDCRPFDPTLQPGVAVGHLRAEGMRFFLLSAPHWIQSFLRALWPLSADFHSLQAWHIGRSQ